MRAVLLKYFRGLISFVGVAPRILISLIFLVFFILCSGVKAAELTEPDILYQKENPLKVHGFVSQGYLHSIGNNFLSPTSTRGTFDFTEAGINLTKPMSDRMTMGFQFFGRRMGANGNFGARLDWFYVDYRWFDALGLRFGRVKIPFGLYNEINDVDSGRVPILLPQSMYPPLNRDFLLAQNGVEVYGYRDLAQMGALDYRFYVGTIVIDLSTSTSTTQLTNLKVPYLAGGRILWETPVQGLKGGLSAQTLRLDVDAIRSGVSYPIGIPALLWVSSLEYVRNDLLLSAEYGKWNTETITVLPFLSGKSINERAYGMANYRLNNWLQSGVYYSIYFPKIDNRVGRETALRDLAFSLRFDLTSNWLLKIEAHYMNGTAGLSTGFNSGRPLNTLSPSWGAFIIKTTGYF